MRTRKKKTNQPKRETNKQKIKEKNLSTNKKAQNNNKY